MASNRGKKHKELVRQPLNLDEKEEEEEYEETVKNRTFTLHYNDTSSRLDVMDTVMDTTLLLTITVTSTKHPKVLENF